MSSVRSASAKENLHIVGPVHSYSSAPHRYGYRPTGKGEYVPAFHLPARDNVKGSATPPARETFITLQDFLDYQQPLTIAFLGAPGQAAADIPVLEKLQAAIQEQGGKLLILTAVEPRCLRRQLRLSATLTLFYDRDNAVAELFGLFDLQNPLWRWVSGIEEEEQSLPALYVVAPDRKIVYSYVDYHFNLFAGGTQTWLKDLLQSVQAVSRQYRYRPEVYKLVS